VYPKPVLDRMEPSVDALITHVDENSDFVSPEVPEPPAEDEEAPEAEGEEARREGAAAADEPGDAGSRPVSEEEHP
jgi:NADH-quinone oxidoreductase subunit M